jgi:RNA polymerase sigma-70 factor, ECF subfamily
MKSFEELVVENMDSINSISYKFYKSEDDRQDLVQDSILRACNYFHKYTPNTNFRAWMYTIMRNLYLTNYHREKLKLRKFSGNNAKIVEEMIFTKDEHVEFDVDSMSDDVKAVLAEIRKDYLDVLLIVAGEDLEYKEAAERLSIPIGTIMSRLFRAKKYAREHLAAYAKKNYNLEYGAGYAA